MGDQFQSFQVLPLLHLHVEVRKVDEAAERVSQACLIFQDPPDGGVVGEYVLRVAEEGRHTKDVFPPLVIGPGTRLSVHDPANSACSITEAALVVRYVLKFRNGQEMAAFERDMRVRMRVMGLAHKVSHLRTALK